MALKQQIQLIRHNSTFWLIVALFGLIAVMNFSGVYQRLNAAFYLGFNQVSEIQESDIVVLESQNLNDEIDALLAALDMMSPNSIVVFSHPLNSTIHIKTPAFYPYLNKNQCLTSISDWMGYSVLLSKGQQHCDNVWDDIFQLDNTRQNQLLNFSLSPHALPKFKSKRLLSGDLLKEQIQNKVVLVTQQELPFAPKLRAPKLSFLSNPVYLHAYVAHNYATKSLISPMSGWQFWLCQYLLVAFLIVIFQRFSITANIFIACTIAIINTGLGLSVFLFYNMMLPLGQLTSHAFLTLGWVVFLSKWAEETNLRQLLGTVKQRMLGRYLPKSFTEQATPWDSIIQLVNQQLSLHKSIFLARLEGDHRLYEIRAVNCQLSDILEMRRDYERPPYSDAIKAFGVVKTPRPFFNELDEDEVQYIAPLMYAGDVRGFWAMTVKQTDEFNETAFCKNVNRFASQVGELLFHFRVFEDQDQSKNNAVTKALTLNLKKPISQQVKSAINEMEHKLSTLEHVLNQVQTATVLFNLFGQVVQVNESLEKLVKQHDISIFDMTALDFLCLVAHLDTTVAKGKLRYLTLQNGTISVPAYLGDSVYALHIKSVISPPQTSAAGSPLEVGGILFEFVDLTTILNSLSDKDRVISRLKSDSESDSEHTPEQRIWITQ